MTRYGEEGFLTGIYREKVSAVSGNGTVVGGAISAATAAAITTAFGEAYIAALEKLFTRGDGEPPTPEEVVKAFKEQYSTRAK